MNVKELAEQTDITMANVYACYEKHIERFAELVRQDERELCAKLCDDIDVEYQGEDVLATWCAAAIRARSKHD